MHGDGFGADDGDELGANVGIDDEMRMENGLAPVVQEEERATKRSVPKEYARRSVSRGECRLEKERGVGGEGDLRSYSSSKIEFNPCGVKQTKQAGTSLA